MDTNNTFSTQEPDYKQYADRFAKKLRQLRNELSYEIEVAESDNRSEFTDDLLSEYDNIVNKTQEKSS
jgi:hypothetical protein